MAKFTALQRLPLQSSRFVKQNFGTRLFTVSSRQETGPVKSFETIAKDVFEKDKRPVILFDGVCNFCNGGVNLVLSLDDKEAFRFAALQSDVGKALLQECKRHPEDISSMVVVEENGFFIRSDAALKIGERLRIPFPLLSALFAFVPRVARDKGYDWIADNRYKLFGIRDECRISDRRHQKRFMS